MKRRKMIGLLVLASVCAIVTAVANYIWSIGEPGRPEHTTIETTLKKVQAILGWSGNGQSASGLGIPLDGQAYYFRTLPGKVTKFANPGRVGSAALSPDGKTVASATVGGATVTLWDVATRTQRAILRELNAGFARNP